ncbi:unnamed protein product [Prunus brigantina]
MNQKQLMDMGFQGHAYTWKGHKAEGVFIQERLDRGLINYSWKEVWPCSIVIHLLDVGSDHCPILILTEGRQEKVSRPFKFEAYWVFDPECGEVIHRSWNTNNWRGIVTCWSKKQRSPVSDEEIKEVAFQLGASKAPGPDGFSGIFYHNYWEIIREDLCKMVKAFFQGEFSVHCLNMTEIALIPKVPNTEAVTQFRPIALCNFTYKIISKILANHMKPMLAEIISLQQSAFIPGR